MRKIKKYVTLLYASSKLKRVYSKKDGRAFKFKVNFITLTLPSTQKHSDNYLLTKALQPFVRTMKRKYSMHHYLWKAERQKNGNLHFHITANVFIHHTDVRRHWNYLMMKLGYIDETANPNPNSTDIHAVKATKSLAAYIAKYISKASEDSQPITCKLWDCSNELKSFNFTLYDVGWDADANEKYRELMKDAEIRQFDFCKIIIHPKQLNEQRSKVAVAYRQALEELTISSGQRDIYETTALVES